MSRAALSALVSAAVLSSACAALPARNDGRHAAGVFRASIVSGDELPKNVYYDPASIDRMEGSGVFASYGVRVRNLSQTTSRESVHLWLGPEVVVGFASASTWAGLEADAPSGISQTFVLALARARLFGRSGTATPTNHFWNRFELGGAGGLASVWFSEDAMRRDGTPMANPVTDTELGPAVGFSFGFWLSEAVVIRLDGNYMFLSPELSFRWPGGKRMHGLGGIGIVIVK
jgi:hypothetical protein